MKKYTEKLERHEKNKPQKVEKPTNSEKDSKKIEGIDTNIDFQFDLIGNERFRSGDINTHFIHDEFGL